MSLSLNDLNISQSLIAGMVNCYSNLKRLEDIFILITGDCFMFDKKFFLSFQKGVQYGNYNYFSLKKTVGEIIKSAVFTSKIKTII